MPEPEQHVVLRADPDGADAGDAVRRLRAALPEAAIDGPDEHGAVTVALAAGSYRDAARRVQDVIAASGRDDPLRVTDEGATTRLHPGDPSGGSGP